MKLSRHNGRGKNYTAKHNDRNFDVSLADHINEEKSSENIYWDIYRGYTTEAVLDSNSGKQNGKIRSFEDSEIRFYKETFHHFVEEQNKRNEKNYHPERNRTELDLYQDVRTTPEESILQVGKYGETIDKDSLEVITKDYLKWFRKNFGKHVIILNWALHMDEKTPHVQERHVFICENKYGEIAPCQKDALKTLNIPLPEPNKKESRTNNRKITFDKICRHKLLEICKSHGLDIEEIPSEDKKHHIEKNDYILEEQQKKITNTDIQIVKKQTELSDLMEEISNQEDFIDDIFSEACETLEKEHLEIIRNETKKQSAHILEELHNEALKDKTLTPENKGFLSRCFKSIEDKFALALGVVVKHVQKAIHSPENEKRIAEKIETAKPTLKAKLERNIQKSKEIQRNKPPVSKKRDPQSL